MTLRLFLFCCLFLVGCTSPSIYIPTGQAVQLREEIKNAPIWVKTKDNTTEPAIMNIPVGWYCLPDDSNNN